MRVGAINFRSVEINLTIVEDNACTIIIKRLARININIDYTSLVVYCRSTFIHCHPYQRITTQVCIVICIFLEVNDSLVNNHITVTVGGHTGTCVIYSNYTTFQVGRNSVVTSATPGVCPGCHTNAIIFCRCPRKIGMQTGGVIVINP